MACSVPAHSIDFCFLIYSRMSKTLANTESDAFRDIFDNLQTWLACKSNDTVFGAFPFAVIGIISMMSIL